ncbi:Malonyl-CoA-acyl carrier protein transacylase, mitochondrial [Tetrabaena socialis]|uniref:Malonyl-CoA-acyl carrier protein transacylase, mitochondrial n=1 Tax=Tetrabaena socialis TaxID=47790 RepID=A0A2J7ZYA5_9CHLO|nr:Malonyl-CoA-acyl carrier protein transacylase, mitochondrial [Tetrabaena socialis]|eukprot:PNH05242.1 Malonyl-CoA-acyl carrier protein transacylase, mitochondrial [Tetrabaena socialis]
MSLAISAQRCALNGRAAAFKPFAPSLSIRGRKALSVRAVADDAFAAYKPTVAALFPGQGAQSVGMAKDLVAGVPAAKEMFDKASEILGYDLLQLCVEGPKERLDSTAISQPAIYVASLAAVEKLRATEGQAAIDAIDVACGLSLGEYTALAFAGAMSFEDGLRLVKLRGESMQAAADAQPSSMVSVIGLDSGKVAELCKVTSPVLWEDTIKTLMSKGLTKSYEIGPGKVIAGIIKRIDKAAAVVNITA